MATVASSPLTVRSFSEPPDGWDEYVGASPAGSIYHLGGWHRVMTDVMGHECHYLVVEAEGRGMLGVLPLVRVRSRLFGDHLVSMAFLNGGGPLGGADAQEVLCNAAVVEAQRCGVRSMELRARERVQGTLDESARRITVLLPLPATEDELWHSFHPKLRANVRRASREGVEMRYGSDQVDAFYEVFARNMRDLGTPVLPVAFFHSIADTFADHVVFSASYWKGQPIAAQCSFVWGSELEMVWGSSIREFNRLKVTTLIHWEFMKRAIGLGLRTFNFGRCRPDSGTHEFKKRWGGMDEALPWATWARSAGAGVATADSARFRMAVSAWQKLPLATANRLGPFISRQLP